MSYYCTYFPLNGTGVQRKVSEDAGLGLSSKFFALKLNQVSRPWVANSIPFFFTVSANLFRLCKRGLFVH